jgi:hypothetical protein
LVKKSTSGLAAELAVAAIAMIFTAGLALAAGRAMAQTAAGTDAEIRPDFGLLLQPPIRRHWADHHYWGRGPDYYPGGPPGVYPYPGGPPGFDPRGPYYHQPSITVDCADTRWAHRNPIQDAIDHVDDGGTVLIRHASVACVGSLMIQHSVRIAAESASAFSGEPNASPAVIEADPQLPCLTIGPPAPGIKVKVELHDVIIRTEHGGDAPCIVSTDADVALIHSKVVYQGEASAVAVIRGWFHARDSEIVTRGYDPALTTEHASVELDGVKVVAPETGVDISPLANGATSLEYVTVRAGPGDDPVVRPEVGIFLRLARDATSPAEANVEHVKVVGFDTGMGFQQGLHVTVHQSQILGARIGVASDADVLALTDSAVGASHTGVSVISGEATIRHNFIFGFRYAPIERESDGRRPDRGRGDIHGPGDGRGVRLDPAREGSWGGPDLTNLIYPQDPYECGGRFHVFDYWCHVNPPAFVLLDDDQPGMRPGWEGEAFREPAPLSCFVRYEESHLFGDHLIWKHDPHRVCDRPDWDRPRG